MHMSVAATWMKLATHVGGNVIWIVLRAGRIKVFSVALKDAAVVAPARTFDRVGTLGGR